MFAIPTKRCKYRKPKPPNRELLILFLALALATWGCRPSGQNPIVIFCSPDSPRMRQAIGGLEENLKDLPLKVVCAPASDRGIREQLWRARQLRPRLLVVLGTPALLQVAPVEKSTPVVFALVANPYFSKAAYAAEHPEDHQENVTGIASPPPLEAALKEGSGLLGSAPWGLLYDPTDGVAAELAQEFGQLAPSLGIKPLIEESRAAATDRPQLERLLARGARVIYLPPAASAMRYAPLLLDWGRRLKVKVVSGYPEGPHRGALLWLALDYRRLGAETAALARRVLQGESPQAIPIAQMTPIIMEVDEKLLRQWSGYPPPRPVP
ncbi:MAG: ABC transporter substrate-binding protein [Desulfobaccales bacterium]